MKSSLPIFLAALSCHAGSAAGEIPQGTLRPVVIGSAVQGWSGGGFEIREGTLVSGAEEHRLTSDRLYANFVFDCEFKLEPGANGGIAFHAGPSSGGLEVQMLDDSAPQFAAIPPDQRHGSLYRHAAASATALKPAGQWNRQRIAVLGPSLVVVLNGEVILQANLDALATDRPDEPALRKRAGHLSLLAQGLGVTYRRLQIAEFPPPAHEDGVIAAGFTRLFQSGSLAGWRHPSDGGAFHWRAEGSLLRHDGRQGTPADLWTEAAFGDFTLVFDWRWNTPGPRKRQPVVLADGTEKTGPDGQPELVEIEELDSGVYLRGDHRYQVNLWDWPIGSGEVYGVRTHPGQLADVRAAVTPRAKADRPIGEWNRTMIQLEGDRLTVTLNGQVVIDRTRLPGIPPQGPIGLQHHGAPIDFANLWIKTADPR